MSQRSVLYLVGLGISLGSGLFAAWVCYPGARAGLVAQGLWRAELISYDYRLSYTKPLGRSPDIVLVTIDEESFSQPELNRWPWPRSFHAKVIRNLAKAGARLIGVDIVLAGVSGEPAAEAAESEEWALEPPPSEDDIELTEALKEAGNVILAMEVASEGVAGKEGEAELVVGSFPYWEFEEAALGLAAVNVPEDIDGSVRRYWTSIVHQDETFPTMAIALASLYRQDDTLKVADGALSQGHAKHPALASDSFLIRYRAPIGLGFERIPYHRVLANGFLEDEFYRSKVAGKIVLIGATASLLQDLYETPVALRGVGGSGDKTARMPGVEIIAHATGTVLNSRYILPLAPAAAGMLTLLFSAAMGLALIWLRPLKALLLGWLPLVIVAIVLAFVVFWGRSLWVPLVPLLLGVTLSYTLGTVYLELTADREQRRLRRAWAKRVSPEVLEVILNNPGLTKVTGRRVVGTVFFSDLEGFTSFCHSSAPERVVEQINKYLGLATQVIRKHGGTLHKFIGDGVMAVFGDPVPQEDHARRALAASVELQKRMAALRDAQSSEAWAMFVRVGLHTGELVAGDIGSEDMLEYTVMGDTVSTASRLEGYNKELGTDILMSKATAERVGEGFKLESLGEINVRGRAVPVEVYTVKGALE